MRIFFPSAAEMLTDQAGNGEGLIAWNLLNGLAERGHDIVACVRRSELTCHATFEVVELNDRSRVDALKPIAYARAASRELLDRGPDRFDVAHWLFPDSASGFPLSAAHGVPLIVGPIVQPWNNQRWWPPGFVLSRMLQPFFDARTRKLLAGSSTILVAEPGARSRLRQPLSSQARLLPFGLAVDDYKVTPLPTKPRVLYLGRLDKNKRIGDLIAAFPCVQARFPEIELVIAGEGPSEGELKRQAHALGIGQATTFVGKVAHSSVPQLLSEASLLCLPSRGEPFGMVLLEAMASGRAVVATRSGGPAWIVDDGDGGRLVAPCDPAAFADALIDLFADRTRLEAAGRANRTRAEDIFDLNCILERLETLYSEAIGSSDQCGRPTRP